MILRRDHYDMNRKRNFLVLLSLIITGIMAMVAMPHAPAGLYGGAYAQTTDDAKDTSTVNNLRPADDADKNPPVVSEKQTEQIMAPQEPAAKEQDAKPSTDGVKKDIPARDVRTEDAVRGRGSAGMQPDDGLLDITEGSFKYKRIPKIKLSDIGFGVSRPQMSPGGEKGAIAPEANSEKEGLFGLSQRATDVLVWIIFIGVIFLVFVLYRFRAHGRQSSVLKRFPRS